MEQKKKFKFHISGKFRRRFVRVAVVLLSLYILLLVTLSIYVSFSEDKWLGFLNDKLKDVIPGELKIAKSEINVWKSFPKVGITLNNVTINDSLYHKPFLKAEFVTGKISFSDLIGKKLKINTVEIENAVVHSFTDAGGYTNNYVVKLQNKPGKKKKLVVFSNIQLENVVAVNEDVVKNKRYEIRIDDADIEMALRGSKYHIKLNEDIFVRGLGFNLEKGYWLENQRVQGKWKMQFDTKTNILSANKTKVDIQGQGIVIDGIFFLNAPAHFTLNASAKEIDYNAARAMLKPTTSVKIKSINLEKTVDADVSIEGPLAYKTMPLVKLNFYVKDNNMNTPVADFSACNFSGTYINQVNPELPTSDENSRVAIKEFASNWGDINLKAKHIVLTDLIKPQLQFEFFSQCTLPQLDEQLASSTLQFLEGNAKLYLVYNGPLIADPSLLDRVNAKIQVQNGKIVYVPRNLNFSECKGDVIISGNNLLMKDFKCSLNTNEFIVSVEGKNLNRISANQTGRTAVNCSVFTPSLDLSAFKTLFAKKASNAIVKKKSRSLAGTARAVDNAVENGDMFINVKADKVSLHHFIANNVIANIHFKANDWEIQHASLQHADGNLDLTATLQQLQNGYHRANAQINLQHINIKKLFYGFDNFGQSGITYNNLKGTMDAQAGITADINNASKLLRNTMNGSIDFSLKNAALIDLEALKNLQRYIFKNRNLDNVEFADLTNTFDIKNGDIYIHRMPIQSSALTMYVEGIYSFDNRTDISIRVPLSTLTKRTEDYVETKEIKPEQPGPSINLRATDNNGQIKIGLDNSKKIKKKKHKKELK